MDLVYFEDVGVISWDKQCYVKYNLFPIVANTVLISSKSNFGRHWFTLFQQNIQHKG